MISELFKRPYLIGDDLASVTGRDTTHIVVNGREHGDGLLGHIHT